MTEIPSDITVHTYFPKTSPEEEPAIKETFVFRVPNPREYAKISLRANTLRRMDEPATGGSASGVDSFAADLYQAFALFETLLIGADAKGNWPYSEGRDGKPVVDSTKFPVSSMITVQEVYQGFMQALGAFLT